MASTACFAGSPHTNKVTTKNIPSAVKIDLGPGYELTSREIKQVLVLAKQCGITNPGVISDFYFLPGARKEGVKIQSLLRIDGRNTRYETLHIHKTGWSYEERPASAKHVGNFWVGADEHVWKTLLRSYQWTNQQPFQVEIRNDVPISVADKLIDSLLTDGLPFSERRKEPKIPGLTEMENIPGKPKDIRPESIYKGDLKNTYKVEFHRQLVFEYLLENGKFIYKDSYQYEI